MKEIPIKEEHLFKVTEFTKRLAELRVIVEQADSKTTYEKALSDIKRVDKELKEYLAVRYFQPRYRGLGLKWGLFETRLGFYVRIGSQSELKKLARHNPNRPPNLDL